MSLSAAKHEPTALSCHGNIPQEWLMGGQISLTSLILLFFNQKQSQ